MALNFPDSPTLNQVYTDTTSGFSYQWDGVVWQSYTPASSNQIKIVDNISGSFNGLTQIFSLTVSGTPLFPAKAQQLRVVLGGIIQEPETDYTVSNSNIIFTTSPISGLDCSIISLGSAVPINTIEDGTVLPEKLSTGAPSWNSNGDSTISGNLNVSGIVTATSFVKSGGTSSQFLKADGSSDSLNNLTAGSYITYNSGSTYNGSSAITISANGSSSNTANTLVARDASGDFTAGTINCANLTATFTVTATDINSTSDATLKSNIETVENGLETIKSLRGVTFDWKATQKSSIGVIAQELEKVLPELVTDGDPKTVNYNGLIAILIQAVKELSAEVEDLKKSLNN